MFLNASIRWAMSIRWVMSIVLALTCIQLVNAQGSHRVLAPPSQAPRSLDPDEELIREVERFVNNSDRSLDIDPDEIDPELLEMAQRWAQQFKKPEDLPDDFKELIESLGAKLRKPENGLPGNGLPPNTSPNQRGPNRHATPVPRNDKNGDPNNSLRDPDGNILDPDLFEPPNFNDTNNGDPIGTNPTGSDPPNGFETQNRDPNNPKIPIPVRRPNGDPNFPDGSFVPPELPNESGIPNESGKPNGNRDSVTEPRPNGQQTDNGEQKPKLTPGDIVPEGDRDSGSHRSEILDSLRDSDLTIKQQWNRILEQARRDAILNENPASEENNNSALSRFLENAFGETIGDAVDQTHQPGSRPRAKSVRGPWSTNNSNSRHSSIDSSNGNSGNGNSGTNTPLRNRENPFLPNSDSRDNPNANGSNSSNGYDSNNSNSRDSTPGNSTPGNSTPGNSTPGNSTPGNSANPNRNGIDRDWPDNFDESNSNSNRTNNSNGRTSNRNENNSSRNNPRGSAHREKGGFSKGMNDWASFGEDLFKKVANAEQPNSSDPQADPESSDGSNHEQSSSAFSIQTPFMLMLILLVLAGCGIWLLKVRQQKIAVAAQLAAKATQMPMDLTTKTDVLDAFHAMSAKTAAADAPWWTHRRAATELFESAPHGRHALEALTTVYEQARYLPSDEPLDPNELSTARKALTLYDHQ